MESSKSRSNCKRLSRCQIFARGEASSRRVSRLRDRLRPTGLGLSHGLSRRPEGEVRAVEPEVRTVVRVPGTQELAPLQVEQVVLPLEPRLLLGRVLVAAGLRFEVVQLRVG